MCGDRLRNWSLFFLVRHGFHELRRIARIDLDVGYVDLVLGVFERFKSVFGSVKMLVAWLEGSSLRGHKNKGCWFLQICSPLWGQNVLKHYGVER
jgi:hypothetical protein